MKHNLRWPCALPKFISDSSSSTTLYRHCPPPANGGQKYKLWMYSWCGGPWYGGPWFQAVCPRIRLYYRHLQVVTRRWLCPRIDILLHRFKVCILPRSGLQHKAVSTCIQILLGSESWAHARQQPRIVLRELNVTNPNRSRLMKLAASTRLDKDLVCKHVSAFVTACLREEAHGY